jgi:ADP-ribosyl-[dinitrogen reductase] hydrolase
MDKAERIAGGLWGVVVGDALGLPVQFKSRAEVRENPVKDMVGFGTFNLPAGSWSDDSSLTLCLAESLAEGYNVRNIMEKFVAWMYEGYMTPYGFSFDIGNTTAIAIKQMHDYLNGTMYNRRDWSGYGPSKDSDNGNGSLMRILPAAIKFHGDPWLREKVSQLSGMTHGHLRSTTACWLYAMIAGELLQGKEAQVAYEAPLAIFKRWVNSKERVHFERITAGNIGELDEYEIMSSGYVIHSLEAALWCLLRHDNYADTVLEAVNLGDDTDTTAAIAGGLAGILYGRQGIPQKWIDTLARKDMVENVIQRFVEVCII